MSQFWYDEHTARTLAAEVARMGGRVACIACPSLFRQLKARAARSAMQPLWPDSAAEVTSLPQARLHTNCTDCQTFSCGNASQLVSACLPLQLDQPQVQCDLLEFDRRFEQARPGRTASAQQSDLTRSAGANPPALPDSARRMRPLWRSRQPSCNSTGMSLAGTLGMSFNIPAVVPPLMRAAWQLHLLRLQ